MQSETKEELEGTWGWCVWPKTSECVRCQILLVSDGELGLVLVPGARLTWGREELQQHGRHQDLGCSLTYTEVGIILSKLAASETQPPPVKTNIHTSLPAGRALGLKSWLLKSYQTSVIPAFRVRLGSWSPLQRMELGLVAVLGTKLIVCKGVQGTPKERTALLSLMA